MVVTCRMKSQLLICGKVGSLGFLSRGHGKGVAQFSVEVQARESTFRLEVSSLHWLRIGAGHSTSYTQAILELVILLHVSYTGFELAIDAFLFALLGKELLFAGVVCFMGNPFTEFPPCLELCLIARGGKIWS